jgi:dolichol-phosphate mannosyltransferase
MATLYAGFEFAKQPFLYSQIAATILAMTWNYFLNNVFTFKDLRLKGWRILTGLLSFYAVCAIGAISNVGVASYIFKRDEVWWLAGIAGILVGMVWNYAVSSRITWGARR